MKYLHLHVLDNKVKTEEDAINLISEGTAGPNNTNILWTTPNVFVGDLDDLGQSPTIKTVKAIFGGSFVRLTANIIKRIMSAFVLENETDYEIMPAWMADEYLLTFEGRTGFLVEWEDGL